MVGVPQITDRIQPSRLDDYIQNIFGPFLNGFPSPKTGFPDNLSDIASTLVPDGLDVDNPLFVDSRLFNLNNLIDIRNFGENISDAAIDKIRQEIQRVQENFSDFAAGFVVSLDENLTFGLADKYFGTFFPEFQIDKEALESSLSAQVGELTGDVVGLVTGASEFTQGTIIGVGGSATLVAVPVGAARAGYGVLVVKQSAIALAEDVNDVTELLGRQVFLTEGSESFNPDIPDNSSGSDGLNDGLLDNDVLDAIDRLGVDPTSINITPDNTVTAKIDLAETLAKGDIDLLLDVFREQGATKVSVESGFIANEKLFNTLTRLAERGRSFQGGRVRISDSPNTDFIIDFEL